MLRFQSIKCIIPHPQNFHVNSLNKMFSYIHIVLCMPRLPSPGFIKILWNYSLLFVIHSANHYTFVEFFMKLRLLLQAKNLANIIIIVVVIVRGEIGAISNISEINKNISLCCFSTVFCNTRRIAPKFPRLSTSFASIFFFFSFHFPLYP